MAVPKCIPYLTEVDIQRFWTKVTITANERDCWLWKGKGRRRGYGEFSISRNSTVRNLMPHRVAYQLVKGAPNPWLLILHSCRNKLCVNPAHLREGTAKENAQDEIDADCIRRGQDINTAKLTNEQVREIRQKYASGTYTLRGLGSEYGVWKNAIWAIVHRLHYRHIV